MQGNPQEVGHSFSEITHAGQFTLDLFFKKQMKGQFLRAKVRDETEGLEGTSPAIRLVREKVRGNKIRVYLPHSMKVLSFYLYET